MDGTCILFEEFLKTIPAEFEVIPIVLPSHDNCSYQQYANHVVKILEEKQLQGKSISIIAESFGGRIAYELLNNRACNIKRIIFAASFVSSPSLISQFSALLPQSIVKRNLLPDWFLKISLFGSMNSDAPLTLFKKAIRATSEKTLSNRLKQIRELTVPTKAITVPVTYIQATRDTLVSKKAACEIRRLSKNFELKKIKGGHFILQSNPEACWEAIYETFSHDENNLNYHFEETLKLLVVLSSPPDIQLEAYAHISPEEEIANDLLFHFVEQHQLFIEQDYLPNFVAKDILEIDQTFSNLSTKEHEAFWVGIESDERWEQLRIKAKKILMTLGKGDLKIDISTTIKDSILSVITTEIKLIE